ncbi:unnamed protein product [Litomosoides sigmodontis]|uniref:Uncharacterized protein n=1 Tax=Litomosoides sigmodontis TaxID=42156 RepID=A0A3P6V1I9_LITSI|nr:unnamed protein product [Litomosoides sigmodontis]
MPNVMYSCPMTQPPTLSINLPLGNLTIPVHMSPSYIPSTIISTPVTCSVTSSSIVPPPPYHTINLNNVSYDATDIDVVGITDVARDVHLDDDLDHEEQYNKPLDLSLKKREVRCLPSCSTVPKSQPRPTVIRNGYVQRNADMRRSASSVTSRPAPEPDVSEHFRRSLSGKWPRRQTNYVHYTPPLQTDVDKKIFGSQLHCKINQTTEIRSTSSCNGSSARQIVVNNSGIEIEDHFRKALGAEAYELLRGNR